MAKNLAQNAGKEAIEKLGWWRAHRFLVLRRLCQLTIIALFMAGPTLGVLTGNLSSSMLLDTVPLSDPLIVLQALATGHIPEFNALLGVVIVVVFYAILAPRAFCAWVCPLNIVTDLAAWLRRKFNIKASYRWSPAIRYWLIPVLMLGSALSGAILWTWLDPVAALHRGLVFGMGAGWVLIALVFVLDLLLVEHGWCGHLCPLGATYGVIGRKSLLRVTAVRREDCTKCMDCFYVCPEPEVLRQPLKEGDRRVMDQNCISCGRCLDVCPEHVFEFKNRLNVKNID
ncbi:TPA: quinol dehydrogenase ferredoxin subunit NapH [Vibrio parahaemolyticus]|uniref:Quinol dehydrogenase ferredoxin subunit NapH n=3 Tax=Vibrio parahaemolyticus TaxID=670 RepID=A0AA46L960_VIBPH|nr:MULTISPECIES: quinol dehydrogenase ferredoxin subunit NapH [Vibrio]EJG0873147.1 quinol dehydrogenase ferredoxin subunit NapH [Vibrio parahaemolyticus O3]EJG0901805.1 quinol dehydrogenase ferredoxin subunit NapH [Vibrio parahaemolyticus O3:K56]EJG1076421.1 quinol dehydrogenase ferredoxin subunit NapH [Vibrio parahaemolyticus O1:K56]NVJ67595.1 quinol dehydrogenase ferredoxin subunit NapH [Gammaproteobacteria bacterium]PWF68952.1 quinol dehydrogenase ferredoxin subunit NapH [Vibrio sp. T21]